MCLFTPSDSGPWVIISEICGPLGLYSWTCNLPSTVTQKVLTLPRVGCQTFLISTHISQAAILISCLLKWYFLVPLEGFYLLSISVGVPLQRILTYLIWLDFICFICYYNFL